MFISKKLELHKTGKGKSLLAKSRIEKDETLIKFECIVLQKPTKASFAALAAQKTALALLGDSNI